MEKHDLIAYRDRVDAMYNDLLIEIGELGMLRDSINVAGGLVFSQESAVADEIIDALTASMSNLVLVRQLLDSKINAR